MRCSSRLAAAAAVATTGVLLLGGCNSDDNPAIELPDATSTTAMLDGSPTTSGGDRGSTTVPASARPATAELAAQGLFDAWRDNDRGAAQRFATQRAIDDLFGSRGSAEGLESHGCEPEGAGRFSCSWRYEGGALIMTVETAPEGGFVVEMIRFIAD